MATQTSAPSSPVEYRLGPAPHWVRPGKRPRLLVFATCSDQKEPFTDWTIPDKVTVDKDGNLSVTLKKGWSDPQKFFNLDDPVVRPVVSLEVEAKLLPAEAEAEEPASYRVTGCVERETVEVFRKMVEARSGDQTLIPATTSERVPFVGARVSFYDDQRRLLGSATTGATGEFSFRTSYRGSIIVRLARSQRAGDALLVLDSSDELRYTLGGDDGDNGDDGTEHTEEEPEGEEVIEKRRAAVPPKGQARDARKGDRDSKAFLEKEARPDPIGKAPSGKGTPDQDAPDEDETDEEEIEEDETEGEVIDDRKPPSGGSRDVVLGPGGKSETFVYRYAPGSISGRVHDGQLGIQGLTPSVRMELFGVTFEVPATESDAMGEYEIGDLPPGQGHVILPDKATASDGKHWEISDGAQMEIPVQVRSGQTTEAEDVLYGGERHAIRYFVVGSDGSPVEGALVEVYIADGDDDEPLAQQTSDSTGMVYFEVPDAGEYRLDVYAPGVDRPVFARVLCNSVSEGQVVVPTSGGWTASGALASTMARKGPVSRTGSGSSTGGNGSSDGIPVDATLDNGYPLLTAPIGLSSPTTSSSGGGAPSALGDVASRAIGQVLGWKLKPADHKGFANALKQRFDLRDFEGHVEWTYKPGNYMMASDLSSDQPITGAQASLLAQMRNASDRGLALLEPLYSLRILADPEDGPALKALIKQLIDRLVEEMGTPGGPRIPLVDSLFDQLIGTHAGPVEADQVSGALGTLRDEFGLRFDTTKSLVNTVEEEENLTNYRIMVDYVSGVCVSWDHNRDYFNRNVKRPFFGTQLVLISRQLSVITSEVDQVRLIFDSVFLDEAERLTTRIPFKTTAPGDAPALRLSAAPPGGETAFAVYSDRDAGLEEGPTMAVEELLTWCQSCAAEEWCDQLEDGGMYGARNHFLPEAVRLRNLVYAAVDSDVLALMPRGYRTKRVIQSLQSLGSQLDEAAALVVGLSHAIPSQGNGSSNGNGVTAPAGGIAGAGGSIRTVRPGGAGAVGTGTAAAARGAAIPTSASGRRTAGTGGIPGSFAAGARSSK